MTVAGSHPHTDIFSTSSARRRPRRYHHIGQPTTLLISSQAHNCHMGEIYSLSEVELKGLKAYIETNIASGFIQRSSSSAV
jgi:hypothetical protein